jgi:hypothetical protein
MIEIKEIQLDVTLPDDGIGMVFMQPFVELCGHGPYCWQNDKKDKQIERIVRTLEIAKQSDHGCEKTHFTIFPEYSIPGVEGIAEIEKIIRDVSWKDGTIIIGGIDGLSKKKYSTLCNESMPPVHDANVRKGQWVNCYITWVKTKNDKGDFIINRWIQPKLCPSWPEEDIIVSDMFEGKCVNVFEGRVIDGRAFRFMSLICYDWIGSSSNTNGIFGILQKINHLPGAEPYGKPMHLSFVLQHNKNPNHPSFLHNAYGFFHQNFSFVDRNKCIVVLVNNAGGTYPGPYKKYGYSSLIFSPQSSYTSEGYPPSYSVATRVLRGNEILQTCKEALFRENGGCINSFRLFHPLFVDRAPESRRRPLGPVLVYALEENIKDPRTPGEQVSAVVKWVNDKVDLLPAFPSFSCQFQMLINDARKKVIKELRWLDEQDLTKVIALATANMTDEERKNVDIWSEKEKRSLECIVYSLTLITCSTPIMIKDAPTHAVIQHNNTVIDIIVVSGGVNHEQNLKHAIKYHPGRKERVTLIISRDQYDNPLTDRDKSIYDVETDIKRCGYYNLRNCLTASTPKELSKKIIRSIGV